MKKKIYIFSLVVFILDLISKLVIKNNLNLSESLTVIPNFFRITYLINDGGAFSILEGQKYVFVVVALIMIFIILKYLHKEKLTNYRMIYYSMLIGGIIGNLFDRIVYNGVIDFLAFRIFGYNFPVFNLADSFIVMSVLLIIIELGKEKYENSRNRK